MIQFNCLYPATCPANFQHPCRFTSNLRKLFAVCKGFVHKFLRKMVLVTTLIVAGPLLLISVAHAELNCTVQPSCSDLGYTKSISSACPADYILYCPFDKSYKKCVIPSCTTLGFTTTDKSAWCGNVIQCPDDTSYTACTAEKTVDCSSYTYSSCPSVASNCSTCTNGQTVKYRIEGCITGFTYANHNCSGNTCSGYTLYSCPSGGVCSECLSGYTKKYKLDSCKTNYVMTNGSCYDCALNYTRIYNKSRIAANSYRRCKETTGTSVCTKCRTSCSDFTSRGSYYESSCFSLSGAPGGSGDYSVCVNALQSVKDEIAVHNAKACSSSYRVKDNINPASQCTTQIECGYAVMYRDN